MDVNSPAKSSLPFAYFTVADNRASVNDWLLWKFVTGVGLAPLSMKSGVSEFERRNFAPQLKAMRFPPS